MGEQGVQEGIEHAPLKGPCVEDQRGIEDKKGGKIKKIKQINLNAS
jgi:hypothetical protein